MASGPGKQLRFQQEVMPHLDSAYNLAYWLTRSDADAQDVVQEAVLRAFKYFDNFEGGNAAPWLLSIVRNACFTWLKRNRPAGEIVGLEERADADEGERLPLFATAREAEANPETILQQQRQARLLNRLL